MRRKDPMKLHFFHCCVQSIVLLTFFLLLNQIPKTIEADSLLASEDIVLIQTAKTTVKNTTKDVSAEVRMFLDCGSQRTYISQQLVDKLQLEPYKTEKLSVNTFGSGRAKIRRSSFRLTTIQLLGPEDLIKMLNAATVVAEGSLHRKYYIAVY